MTVNLGAPLVRDSPARQQLIIPYLVGLLKIDSSELRGNWEEVLRAPIIGMIGMRGKALRGGAVGDPAVDAEFEAEAAGDQEGASGVRWGDTLRIGRGLAGTARQIAAGRGIFRFF